MVRTRSSAKGLDYQSVASAEAVDSGNLKILHGLTKDGGKKSNFEVISQIRLSNLRWKDL
jgi:hypothetical protein